MFTLGHFGLPYIDDMMVQRLKIDIKADVLKLSSIRVSRIM